MAQNDPAIKAALLEIASSDDNWTHVADLMVSVERFTHQIEAVFMHAKREGLSASAIDVALESCQHCQRVIEQKRTAIHTYQSNNRESCAALRAALTREDEGSSA